MHHMLRIIQHYTHSDTSLFLISFISFPFHLKIKLNFLSLPFILHSFFVSFSVALLAAFASAFFGVLFVILFGAVGDFLLVVSHFLLFVG